jgi:PAS domain S-box-containing protein
MAADLFVAERRSQRRAAAPDEDAAQRGQRIAADCGPVLLWTGSVDQQRDWLNGAWESCTGRAVDELLGRGWIECLHPEDTERCLGIFSASCDARRSYTFDFRLRHHDGSYRWMLENGVPRFDAAGALAGYYGSVVDIHERKQLEEQLAERMRALRVAERRQAAFLSMLSHELRNPLAPIANAASVLRTLEEREPVVARLREILERQVHRLDRMIEDLVDATRSARGHITLASERIDLEAVVRGAVEASAAALEAVGHRLELQLPEARLFVKGDRARLVQALVNVVSNAAKFAQQASVISLSMREAGARAEITVRDPGRGSTAEFLPHVLDLFAQEDRAGDGHGVGVGLALARRILRLHGGNIEAQSEGMGRGACFVITLPLVDGSAPSSPDQETAAAPRTCRLLVVEADDDLCDGLRRQLEGWGHLVQVAGDGAHALRTLETFRPHVVLCDLHLPDVGGLDLLGAMRERLAGLGALFAAVGSGGGDDDEARALAAGYDSFLARPVHPGTLARLLRSCACAAG